MSPERAQGGVVRPFSGDFMGEPVQLAHSRDRYTLRAPQRSWGW